MFNNKLGFTICILVIFAAFAAGCSDDDVTNPADENPQELITKVTLTLVKLDGQGNPTTETAAAVFSDPDGSGGTSPSIGTLVLDADAVYNGTIELLDETKNPVENITEEVEEEVDEHQFFYTAEGGIAALISVVSTDTDGNGLPVGLEYRVTVTGGSGATGVLNVVLGHFDEVEKDGVTLSPESDIDIDFPVTIQ